MNFYKILKILAKGQAECEFSLKISKLEKELAEKENSINVNLEQIKELLAQKQQQTESFDKLEIEFNKLNSSLEEAKLIVQRLEADKIVFENENKELKNDIAENKLKITELTIELSDKKTKLEKNITKIEELEMAIKKLSDDLKKQTFENEILRKHLNLIFFQTH